jgi:hypothetical protein
MNTKGQALIEVAVFFMSLSILLAGLCGFTQWVMTRQKLLIAAKQGALMYSSGHMTRPEVEQQMRHFLETGVPAMNSKGIQVTVGPLSGLNAKFNELDQSIAGYTRPGGWYSLLGVDAHMEEKCVIKHAPHYWAPFQTWSGPAVTYGH